MEKPSDSTQIGHWSSKLKWYQAGVGSTGCQPWASYIWVSRNQTLSRIDMLKREWNIPTVRKRK